MKLHEVKSYQLNVNKHYVQLEKMYPLFFILQSVKFQVGSDVNVIWLLFCMHGIICALCRITFTWKFWKSVGKIAPWNPWQLEIVQTVAEGVQRISKIICQSYYTKEKI